MTRFISGTINRVSIHTNMDHRIKVIITLCEAVDSAAVGEGHTIRSAIHKI